MRTEDGKLYLSRKLTQTLFDGDASEYADALIHGQAKDLTYADIQEFQEFTSEFIYRGIYPGVRDGEWFHIISKVPSEKLFGRDVDSELDDECVFEEMEAVPTTRFTPKN